MRCDDGHRRTEARHAGTVGLLTIALSATLIGCGSRDHGVANLPPHVGITGSPVEGDSVNYVVDLFWHSWDDDGEVVRSEYAVDIPSGFTLEQIADPATRIEWTSTTASRVRIRFRVAPSETLDSEPGTFATDRASAAHTFFVRSYDNEGAYSTVAERSFNAWTTLPQTTITSPGLSPPFVFSAYFIVGRCLTVRWTGLDPDGPAPDYRPVRTEYKLIRVQSILGSTDANHIVNVDPGPLYPWIPAPGDSGVLSLTLDPPQAYVLALRSIDEAGGVESRFEFGRNALLISTSAAPFVGRPTLQIHEPLLGSSEFPRDGDVAEFEIIAGQCLNFEMTSDASNYGGTVEAYRWCVDAEESPVEEGTPTGCVPWGATRVLPAICFSTPGLHTVSFAARSAEVCPGIIGITSGTYRINVIPRNFDREVLYVDDFFRPIDPGSGTTDAQMDQRLIDALNAAGYTQVDIYDAWGEGDRNGAVQPPTLALLSRYRLVFWAVSGAGGGTQNGQTALLQASSCRTNRVLQAYVAAGGGVWIHGEMVFGALKNRNAGTGGTCLASTSYSPDTGINFGTGDFVTDFLHIAGGDFRDAKTGPTSNGLLRARPTAPALAEGFPMLEADSTNFAFRSLGGLPFYDAMFQPTFRMEGGLDTLYTAQAVGAQTPFNYKPIAWRYADPSPEPRQGPVVITSFPLQKMKEGAPSRVVDGVRVPGTGLVGLVEVLGAWFRAHDHTGLEAR